MTDFQAKLSCIQLYDQPASVNKSAAAAKMKIKNVGLQKLLVPGIYRIQKLFNISHSVRLSLYHKILIVDNKPSKVVILINKTYDYQRVG